MVQAQEKGKDLREDFLLQYIVTGANYYNMNCFVRLNIKGSTVQGKIISAKDYHKKFGELYAGFFDDEDTVDGIKTRFNELAENFDPANRAYLENDSNLPKFIHLDESVIIKDNNEVGANLGLWRGHISKVDGFSLVQD